MSCHLCHSEVNLIVGDGPTVCGACVKELTEAAARWTTDHEMDESFRRTATWRWLQSGLQGGQTT